MSLRGQAAVNGLAGYVAGRMEGRGGRMSLKQYQKALDLHLDYRDKTYAQDRQQQQYEHDLGKDRASHEHLLGQQALNSEHYRRLDQQQHEHDLGKDRSSHDHLLGQQALDSEQSRRLAQINVEHGNRLEHMREAANLNVQQMGAAFDAHRPGVRTFSGNPDGGMSVSFHPHPDQSLIDEAVEGRLSEIREAQNAKRRERDRARRKAAKGGSGGAS